MVSSLRHGVVYMTVYIHITKAKKTKLEPFEKKYTFVGCRMLHMEIDNEEQIDSPVVRQVAPPSTSSKGARVQRESTLKIY
jgi:hypothetical protein